jgi:hypothetical protein
MEHIMTTTYTFHRAADHGIIATAHPDTLQAAAQNVAASLLGQGTVRVYIHNGRGVVAAMICRDGAAHEVLRDDYRKFDGAARAARVSQGLVNDPVEVLA